MAITNGYEILVGANVATHKKTAEIPRRILQVIEHRTLSVAYAASYSAGGSSTNQLTLTVGTGTVDFGIRIIFDSAVIGADKVSEILRIVSQVLDSEDLVTTHASSYTAGSRTYNLVITLT